MNEHEASVLKQIIDKGGPGWGLAAIFIMNRRALATAIGGFATVAGGVTRALGWW